MEINNFQKQVAAAVVDSLQRGVPHNGCNLAMAQAILPTVQQSVADARFVEVADANVVFYGDKSKGSAIHVVQTNFLAYKRKADAYGRAFDQLTKIDT